MPEGVKHHVGQTSGLFQPFKLIAQHTVFAGTPGFLRQHKIIVDEVLSHKLFELVLLLFPVPQDQRQRLGYPDTPYAALGLRLFQDKARRGLAAHQPGKHEENVAVAQRVDGLLVYTRQLLLHHQVGIIVGNVLVRDMNAVPRQAGDLTEPQRTGKGKVDCHIELAVRAAIQRLTDDVCRPDFALLLLVLRQQNVLKGVFRYHVPPHRLPESAMQQLHDFFNGTGRHIFRAGMAVWGFNRRCLLQLHNKAVHRAAIDVLDIGIAYNRVDVVFNQADIAGVCRKPPPLCPIDFHKFFQKVSDAKLVRRNKDAFIDFVFNLRLSRLGFFLGRERFPFLALHALGILVSVNYREFFASLLN